MDIDKVIRSLEYEELIQLVYLLKGYGNVSERRLLSLISKYI